MSPRDSEKSKSYESLIPSAMSPPTVRSHETARRRFSGLGEASEKPKEAANGIPPNSKDLVNHAEVSPATSRYGRAIKPKSPQIVEGESPKTGKMPKLRKSLTSSPVVTEKSNGFIKKEKVESMETKHEAKHEAKQEAKHEAKQEAKHEAKQEAKLEAKHEAKLEAAADSPVKGEKGSPKNKESLDCEFSLGQLAWAHVGNYPYWPCVVTPDPETQLYMRMKGLGRAYVMFVHVQYFGDKGRHSWVSENAMIPFTGLRDFQKLAKANAGLKMKSPKASTGFVVKPTISAKWEIAIEEATDVMSMTNEQRTEHFKPRTTKTKYEKLVEAASGGKTNGKRDRRSGSAGPNPKRLKREDTSMTEESEEYSVKKKSQKVATEVEEKISINLNTETPPTPPSSHKDSSDESSVVKKAKVKKRKKDLDGDFELYYERNRDMIEDTQPDATEAEIRTYLEKTWENMTLTLRSKYRPRIKPANSVQSKEGSTDQEEESSVDSDSKYIKKTPKSSAKAEKEEPRSSDTTKKTRPYNLFRGTKQERVCQICERTGDLTRCKGPCYSYFHLSCVKPGESSSEYSMDEDTNDDAPSEDSKDIKENTINEDDEKNDDILEDETFKCIDCLSGVAPACFICNEREEDRVRCSAAACGKHYHAHCLKSWPQTHWQGDRLSTCPYHMCHTCISDDPQNGHSRTSNERLVRCVRCPSSYHVSTACLPAGSEILTGSQVICPKHYKAPGPPLNATWCFLCTRGGSLICCDTCPTSFHLECLGINAPDGAFICEDCETGRLPLYGEVVWVKLGSYRWWPSRICFPYEIPRNLEAIAHRPGEFCVMFLGTNNYYWVHRGRVFLYQDGDANAKVSLGRKNVDEAYKKAMQEANQIHQRQKTERVANGTQTRRLKPPYYVKLKVNKPVGNLKNLEVDSIVACECDAKWKNPCAPDTDCLNRILSVECSPGICPAGPKCNNQAFVRREYPAMEPFHTMGRGWGLKALESIKSGQFVIEYVGEVIDEAEYKRRLHHKKELKNENFYFLTIDTNRMIDAEPKGNLSRFMNHSCQPNCETQKWTVNGDTRVGLFALRDIEEGEELTFNYNLACDGETRKPCLCGAPNCSGFIGLKVQKQQPNAIQEAKVEKATEKAAEKAEKVEKVEKVKVQRRSRLSKVIDNNCWTCGESLSNSEDSLTCDQKTCFKTYHKNCVTVEEDDLKFSCPWHHCKECGRRTGAHCSFCSTAYCQAHLDGNLLEYKDKGGYVCEFHEDMDSGKSLTEEEEEKEDSENDAETDKESSSISSDSSLPREKTSMPRESSPRVSIVEVQLSSEEGEESQIEDSSYFEESFDGDNEKIRRTRRKMPERNSHRKKRQEGRIKTLRSLTPSQLEMIIGGSIIRDP